MTALSTLWLPIVVSAVFVFIASFILHMALPWHKRDYRKVPQEDSVMDALRPFNLPAGDYMLPDCRGAADMKSPAFQEKLNKGPVAILTVFPNGCLGMGKSLFLWFVYLLAVGVFTAYVAFHGKHVGDDYGEAFHLRFVTSFLGYGAALWQMSIWYRRSWGTTIRYTIDSLIYAAVTAATFGWLWPR